MHSTLYPAHHNQPIASLWQCSTFVRLKRWVSWTGWLWCFGWGFWVALWALLYCRFCAIWDRTRGLYHLNGHLRGTMRMVQTPHQWQKILRMAYRCGLGSRFQRDWAQFVHRQNQSTQSCLNQCMSCHSKLTIGREADCVDCCRWQMVVPFEHRL